MGTLRNDTNEIAALIQQPTGKGNGAKAAKGLLRPNFGMTTASNAKRLLGCLDDDSLLRMLIEVARDFNDPRFAHAHYDGEQEDINELIREILVRMHHGSSNLS